MKILIAGSAPKTLLALGSDESRKLLASREWPGGAILNSLNTETPSEIDQGRHCFDQEGYRLELAVPLDHHAKIGDVSVTDDEVLVADVALAAKEINAELGSPSAWPSPVALESLAQCVLNAIYSTGNQSESVVRVLDRYRQRRWDAGADPSRDGP